MDIVIVTTSDLRGFQIPEYTYNFYDYNDFKSDGVILVIYAPGGKNPEIFMGNSGVKDSYIFTVYNEGRVNQILAYIYNGYIKDKAYFDACDKYIDIIKGYYATDMRDDEINNNEIAIKNMATGEQTKVKLDDISKIKEIVKR